MPFVAVIVGIVLIVVAFNNSAGNLATALEQDVPAYFKWAVAIAAIGAIGYAPGMRTPSRWLLALVLLVILLKNYTAIFAGFQGFASGSQTSTAGAGAANPSAAYTANPATTATPSASQVAGASSSTTSAGSGSASLPGAVTSLASNPLNPQAYLGAFEQSAGFGGLANV